jgi:hypothetical protein
MTSQKKKNIPSGIKIKRNKKMFKILCTDEKTYNEFLYEYYNMDMPFASLEKYRSHKLFSIYNNPKLKKAQFEKLKLCFAIKDFDEVINKLETIFLEPMDTSSVNLLNRCKVNGYTAEDVFKKIEKDVYIIYDRLMKQFYLKRKVV